MKYTFNDIKKTLKDRDPWWVRIFLEKITNVFLWFFGNFTKVTPNQITIMSLVFAIIAAFCFINEHWIIGALIFQLSLVFDTLDGRLARLTRKYSDIGEFLDNFTDQIKVFILSSSILLGYFFHVVHEFSIESVLLIFFYVFISDLSVIIWLFVEKKLSNRNQPKGQAKQIFLKSLNWSLLHRVVNKIIETLSKYRMRPMWTNVETNCLFFTIVPLLILFLNFNSLLLIIDTLLFIYFILELYSVQKIIKR